MPVAPEVSASLRLYGDAVLRRRCREVAADEDVAELARAMIAAMADQDGVGLAAPQIGDLRRVIVVSDPACDVAPLVMINPRLDETFGPAAVFEEGCLSFPDLYVDVTRPRGAVVTYRDLGGREQVLRDDGFLARVALHELDHLDGVLFIDRLPRWRRWVLGWRLIRLRQRSGEAAA